MNEPIRQECSWCRAVIQDGALLDGQVSHGICAACSEAMDTEIAELEVA